VVIGTGGYSSGLPLLAAIHKGVKTVIQEQNSFPGMTTRRLGKKVNKVCIAFEEAKGYLKKKRYSYWKSHSERYLSNG
jgi:UDP-N-acetylglucosamine--N-acetylmuramyl-(pentapeptide) pyrophosphoryl-undecaprenol N-acetylglucosamine transferase